MRYNFLYNSKWSSESASIGVDRLSNDVYSPREISVTQMRKTKDEPVAAFRPERRLVAALNARLEQTGFKRVARQVRRELDRQVSAVARRDACVVE